MCTATYIKDDKGRLVFTTNRDEMASRPTEPPEIHSVNGQNILFPKDQIAGGSWIGVSQSGLICCLMNGAEGEYNWLGTVAKKSRGQVLLDSFSYENAEAFLEDSSFEKSHPFTLLFVHPKSDGIQAIKWNGEKKWIESFDKTSPHIWSAHTLYPAEQRQERTELFEEWSLDKSNLNAESLLTLHGSTKAAHGLLLTDSNAVNTISITQVILNSNSCSMMYREVVGERQVFVEMEVR